MSKTIALAIVLAMAGLTATAWADEPQVPADHWVDDPYQPHDTTGPNLRAGSAVGYIKHDAAQYTVLRITYYWYFLTISSNSSLGTSEDDSIFM